MSGWIDHLILGIQAVFQFSPDFLLFGFELPITVLMVIGGFLVGIVVGSTPGLAGPMAMAVALPILISIFGYHESALLPVFGFLIGIELFADGNIRHELISKIVKEFPQEKVIFELPVVVLPGITRDVKHKVSTWMMSGTKSG